MKKMKQTRGGGEYRIKRMKAAPILRVSEAPWPAEPALPALRGRRGRAARAAGLRAALLVLVLAWTASRGAAVELCSEEARGMMKQAGIAQAKIDRLCKLARRSSALLTLSMRRGEDQLGYCLVTLALHNNSTLYLNQLALPSADGQFDIFRFHNIMPGRTGYASARSRILLACEELQEVGIRFRWPASLRIGDASPRGNRLARYKPLLLDGAIRWK